MKKLAIVAVLLIIAGGVFFMMPGTKKAKMQLMGADSGWDSQKFHNAVAKVVIEHAFDGYELNFSTASSMMNWESMKAGDIDVDIEAWVDNVPNYPVDKASGAIVDVGVLVPDSSLGVYTLRYVIEGDKERGIAPMAPGLRKVIDLKNYAHVFPDDEKPGKGRIYGGIPGWVSDSVLYKKYQYYGLDKLYEYVRLGSEAAIFTSIEAADNLKQPWVGYCWEPSAIAGKLDLVRLEDEPFNQEDFLEGKTEFKKSELKILANPNFKNKVPPEVYYFFANYRIGSAEVSSALAYLDEHKGTHEETAIWFLREYDGMIDEWLQPENAGKLRNYLATLP